MPRSSASMRTRHAVCVSMKVHTGAPTRPATRSSFSGVVTRRKSARPGADRAHPVELLLVDDPRKLLAEMERLGPRREDRRALAAEDRCRCLVVGDGVEAREAGVGGTPEDDPADSDFQGV